MPKNGFKKYHEERSEMEKFCNKYAFISNFDDNQKKKFSNKIKTQFSFTRSSIDTMITGSLLSKYTFEQIFNPNEEEKIAINRDIEDEKNKLYSMINKEEPLTEDEEKEFNSYAASQFINVVLASKDYLNNIIKDDYSFEKLPFEERKKLYTVFSIQHDASQEMDQIKTFVGEKYKQLVDKDGKKELMSYFEDISNIAFNISAAFNPQSFLHSSILQLSNNEKNLSPRKKAEDDVDTLLNSIIPFMVADSFINDHINNQNEKDISKMNPATPYALGFSLGQTASGMISQEQKNHFIDLMVNPVTKEAILSQIVDTDNSKIFNVNIENNEVNLEPLISTINNMYDEIKYGQSELSKYNSLKEEIYDYSSVKHRQFLKLPGTEKIKLRTGLTTMYSADRTSFDTLIWGRMLLKGYSFEELLNFDENGSEQINKDYDDVKKEFFEKLPKKEEVGNIEKQKNFDTYAAEAFVKVIQYNSKLYIDNMDRKKSFDNFSLAEKQKNVLLVDLAFDAFQELGKIEKSVFVGKTDFERIAKEQNPENANAINEFNEIYKYGMNPISYSINNHKETVQSFENLEESIKNKTEEELLRTSTGSNLRTRIAKIMALKMTERSCADFLKTNTIDKFNYGEIYWGYFAQADDASKQGGKYWIDEKTLAGILADKYKLDAVLYSINREPEKICTINNGEIVDYNPIRERVMEIYNTPSQVIAQEKIIRNKIVKIADMILTSSKKEDDIKSLSNEEKIEMVMKLGCMGNGSGHVYGEEYNEKNPNASSDKKINNYIRELANDVMNGSNEEIYAFLPNKNGHGEFYKINNYTEFTFEEKPRTLFGNNEKSYKIKALEELKLILDKNGETYKDSDEYRRFKKCLDDSIEPLKRTLDADKINEMLNDIADKADAYYIAKLDSPQNDRRSIRFNAASVLRNINKDSFDKKVNMKQNLLDKVAYIYAKDKVKNGTPEEKERYKVVTNPYNREKLTLLAETIALKPNVKNALDNCKDDKQLKALFDKVKKAGDIPEAKNVLKPVKNNNEQPVI